MGERVDADGLSGVHVVGVEEGGGGEDGKDGGGAGAELRLGGGGDGEEDAEELEGGDPPEVGEGLAARGEADGALRTRGTGCDVSRRVLGSFGPSRSGISGHAKTFETQTALRRER